MVGVADCLRVNREYARVCATTSSDVLAGARLFTDFILEKRGWRPSSSVQVKVVHEDFDDYLRRTGNSEVHIESHGSGGRQEASSLADAKHYMPWGLGVVEINQERQLPLMEECLQQDVCECHSDLPGLVTDGPSRAQPHIIDIDDSASDSGTPAGDGDSVRAGDEGEAVDSSETAILEGHMHFDLPPEEALDGTIACKWRERFGGSCTYRAGTSQTHDRHIVTHLPDDEGIQITCLYSCLDCPRQFTRKSSCQRHIRDVHGLGNTNGHWWTDRRPWWWPVELFLTEKYQSESRSPRPPDVRLTWEERIRGIIAKYPTVIDEPLKPPKTKNGGSRGAGRPAKRQRTA